jgi:hypothetical protein
VVTEYPAAIPALLIGTLALLHCFRSGRNASSVLYPTATLLLAGILCFALLLSYHRLAFGSSFRLGYNYTIHFAAASHSGIAGITYPKWNVIKKLLIGKRCGLLLFSPILALSPFGFRMLWRSNVSRASLCVAAAIATYYLLFNASYVNWWAGASFGPRYLSPGIPFTCMLLAPLWQRAKFGIRLPLAALALYGFGASLAGVATHPMVDESLVFPLKAAFHSLLHAEPYSGGGATNLGLINGLHGLASLIPLALIWTAAAAAWFWIDETENCKYQFRPPSR